MDDAVLIPVKSFGDAKGRLSGLLSPEQRRRLARWMAARVVAAARGLPTFVVCDADEVAEWAESVGANVLWRPGHGLNPAVTDGVRTLGGKGFGHVVVSHSDLPLAEDLTFLVRRGQITIVPDLAHDGTNVLSLPTTVEFEFGYGGGSFRRHADAALATGLPVQVVADRRLGRDVDTPAHLDDPLVHALVKDVLPWPPTNPANPR